MIDSEVYVEGYIDSHVAKFNELYDWGRKVLIKELQGKDSSIELNELVEVYKNTQGSSLGKLIATIGYSFNVKMNEKNMKNAEGIIDEEALAKFLEKAPIVESDARKRRRFK